MKRVIEGKIYNTDTAAEVCTLRCAAHPTDFGYHVTKLYRSPRGAYFLAGRGGPMSLWGIPVQGGMGAGDGIRVVTPTEAREYAEAADMSPEAMQAAGFVIEEG